MRVIVFFDLPTKTATDRRNYRKFRKTLITNGFIMMQESVYCRLVLNQSVEKSVISILEREKPDDGCVQVLSVTEKQFSKMDYIVGKSKTDIVDSLERLIIL